MLSPIACEIVASTGLVELGAGGAVYPEGVLYVVEHPESCGPKEWQHGVLT